MDFAATIVKHALEGKTPEQRAQWILGQPMLSELARQLCQLPDGQLLPLLQQISDQNPDYRGISDWILSRGEIWIVETVREMRRIAGVEAKAE